MVSLELDGIPVLLDPSRTTQTARVFQRLRPVVLVVVDLLQRQRHHQRQPLHPLALIGKAGVTLKAAPAAPTPSAGTALLMAVRELDGIMLHGVTSLLTQMTMAQRTTLVVLVVVAILKLPFESATVGPLATVADQASSLGT